ncbi:hypothetical protein ACFQZ1_09780 [Bacillus sp. CGMCC 1.60114]|uniref:hypothetical protein n=1 Tax=unclassified Bacillus (in: firmicutes) TaxID=185979 RepID=UPI00363611D3
MVKHIRLIAAIIVLLGLTLYDKISNNPIVKNCILTILIFVCILVSLEYIFNKHKYTHLDKKLHIFLSIIPLIVAFFMIWLIILSL